MTWAQLHTETWKMAKQDAIENPNPYTDSN